MHCLLQFSKKLSYFQSFKIFQLQDNIVVIQQHPALQAIDIQQIERNRK